MRPRSFARTDRGWTYTPEERWTAGTDTISPARTGTRDVRDISGPRIVLGSYVRTILDFCIPDFLMHNSVVTINNVVRGTSERLTEKSRYTNRDRHYYAMPTFFCGVPVPRHFHNMILIFFYNSPPPCQRRFQNRFQVFSLSSSFSCWSVLFMWILL